jgi:hypothetical protein
VGAMSTKNIFDGKKKVGNKFSFLKVQCHSVTLSGKNAQVKRTQHTENPHMEHSNIVKVLGNSDSVCPGRNLAH